VLLLPPQLCVLTIRRRLKLRLLQSASEISFRFRQDAKCFHWHASNSLSFSSCKCVWAVVCGCVVVEPLAVICMPLKLCKVILSRPQAKSAPIFAIVKVISGFKCELHLSCAQPPAPPPFSLSGSPPFLAISARYLFIASRPASVARANIWPP